MQMPLVEEALRAYVKLIGDYKVVQRFEQSLTPNKPISTAFETLRRDDKIDKDLISL